MEATELLYYQDHALLYMLNVQSLQAYYSLISLIEVDI